MLPLPHLPNSPFPSKFKWCLEIISEAVFEPLIPFLQLYLQFLGSRIPDCLYMLAPINYHTQQPKGSQWACSSTSDHRFLATCTCHSKQLLSCTDVRMINGIVILFEWLLSELKLVPKSCLNRAWTRDQFTLNIYYNGMMIRHVNIKQQQFVVDVMSLTAWVAGKLFVLTSGGFNLLLSEILAQYLVCVQRDHCCT